MNYYNRQRWRWVDTESQRRERGWWLAAGVTRLRRADGLGEAARVAASNLLLVALGSALGGVARYLLTGWVAARVETGLPWGTLVVNLAGSALIGLLAGVEAGPRSWVTAEMRLFLMVGVLGGFTTFSSFSLETLRLLQDGAIVRAVGNVFVSVAGCLAAVALGYRLARALG